MIEALSSFGFDALPAGDSRPSIIALRREGRQRKEPSSSLLRSTTDLESKVREDRAGLAEDDVSAAFAIPEKLPRVTTAIAATSCTKVMEGPSEEDYCRAARAR